MLVKIDGCLWVNSLNVSHIRLVDEGDGTWAVVLSMNNGVTHAIEPISSEEAAYDYFTLLANRLNGEK